MFFKKSIVKEKPPQAKRIDNLLTNITFFSCGLERHVKHMIVAKGVIDLYPDGADKKAAIEHYQDLQDRLINKIAQYDQTKKDYEDAVSKYHNDDYEICPKIIFSSHTIVENAYKDFYKK